MKKLSFLLFTLLVLNTVSAQFFQRLDPVVTRDDPQLPNPWAGGFNAPQWSSIDLNNDGNMDLYAFDRNGSIHLPFLHTGAPGEATYEFAPEYAANFPPCQHFVLIRDYNHDGAADIFASSMDEGIPGFKVFRGKFEDNKLTFKRLEFPWLFDVIIVPASGDYTNLAINAPDYPAISDIDNDGDLDILGLNSVGSQVAFYQNMALEKGYTDDTLIFQVSDNCWGKFYIQPFAQSMTLSTDPNECVFFQAPGGNVEEDRGGIHGGATLCTFDEDNDGDKELLYGDLIYPHIIQGKNGGSVGNGWINDQDTTFPSYNVTIKINDFPATYHLDMDQDGLLDLVASPNISSASLDYNVVWFYKNTQSNEFPYFELQQDNLLVEGMLDLGTGAQPAFIDYNADGLMDIVVGNVNRWKPNFQNDPFLVLLKNVGTATDPAFEVVDQNWLNFNQFAADAFAFAPTFGDLDGDGDLDLLAGERFGRLFYAENTAGPDNPVSFGPIQPNWKGINVGQYATPFIHDLNKDGLPDLIIGERNGNINFFPNMGTPENPAFSPDPDMAPNNRFLGKINTQQTGYVTGYSAPVLLEFNDTLTYLITGSELGFLETYIVNQDSLDGGTFEVVSEKFGNLRDGWITRPAFTNLNGDEFLDAVVGNYRGGLGVFQSPLTVEGLVPAKEVRPVIGMEIFPNPAGSVLHVRLEGSGVKDNKYLIFNTLGQISGEGRFQGSSTEVDVQGLANGIYFLEVNSGHSTATRRFIKK